MSASSDDPGWGPALRPVWQLLVPWIALFVRNRRLDLIGLRRVFHHTGMGLVEIAIVIPSTVVGSARETAWMWVLLGVGSAGALSGLIWSTKAGRRGPPDPAEPQSAASVAKAFRSLSFIRLGLAASPAMYGIVGRQLTGAAAVGFVGAGVSVVFMAVFGPTRSRVDEIEARLRVSGSRLSLRQVLSETA